MADKKRNSKKVGREAHHPAHMRYNASNRRNQHKVARVVRECKHKPKYLAALRNGFGGELGNRVVPDALAAAVLPIVKNYA